MPKKKGAKIVGVATLPEEGFLREPAQPLSLEERKQLRAFFASDLWKKVWRNALTQAPGCALTGLDTALGGVIASNQIHRQQGWEKFRLALLAQIEDKVPRPPRPPENYPEELKVDVKP